MKTALQLAHRHNVKVYVTCNIYARNFEQQAIRAYLESLRTLQPDAVIIADLGILLLAGEIIPDIDIHLSTQANTTNYNSVLFWQKMGIKRINTARELSLGEIAEINQHCHVQIEAFVHGAMCISYSGRCLLSSFLAHRDSNRGLCAHPCRWNYAVVEALRPGQYHPIEEDQRGSYIFNSKDLCMINHIPELLQAGVTSLKIEGRMKGIHYLATVVKTYREALDRYLSNPAVYQAKPEWMQELRKVSHREYCTGFYLNDPSQTAANFEDTRPAVRHRFAGRILKKKGDHRFELDVRNKIFSQMPIEILGKTGSATPDMITAILDNNGNPVPHAQPNSTVDIIVKGQYAANDIVRICNASPGPQPANPPIPPPRFHQA
jgi:putative protease